MKREPFLRRSAGLMLRFGARSGLRACYLLVRKELARGVPGPPKRMRVPQVPHPIWLRESTSDFEAMEQIFVGRAYDLGAWPSHCAMIERTYDQLLESGKLPVIVDCGANIGCATIWFALRFPRAVVYAVEPEPQNFITLGRNVSAYVNVKPIEAAISDRTTRLSLHNPDGEPWACQTVDDEQGSIGTVTVPDLLDRLPNCAPLIVKIDIEGYETSLFRSNTAWAAQTPLVIFELHDWLFHWRGTGDAVFRCLTQRPRDYLVRRDNIFSFAHPEPLVNT